VLSGFVIGYRLLIEQQETGTINLKSFYLRRELRILPLYYLIFIVGVFIMPLLNAPAPSIGAAISIALLVPQLTRGMGAPFGTIYTVWSIGVEELFYFVFPFLVNRFSFPRVAVFVLISSVTVGSIALAVNSPYAEVIREMRFECMAVGALAAWFYVRQSRWLTLLYHPVTQGCSLLLIVYLVAIPHFLPLPDLALSSLIAIMLLNISTNPKSLIKLQFSWSRMMGNLTYGIYMWHAPLVWILAHWLPELALFPATVILSLGIAALSYRAFETPFLRLKDQFRSKPILAATGD
jgi:peptidoglycan/LPS O-acetylase OafA/YrhL